MAKQKITSNEYAYTVIYEPVKPQGYQAIVPLLKGLVTYGRSFEEARKMARDAIICYLEALMKEKEVIPSEAGILQEKILVSV
ncbi:type II toxin-antitoxin system HicB family antitoxin [Candidatus Parcubacteria bacterium]|nr:type II toxin-antitoxin system HicB family antitoxin [Candidatus Parcubacteria bacterium]MDP2951021.1 type II toxin-antitoxin system HicB family antitoxin [bacterium]